MNLKDNLISMGMSPDDASQHAENFVKGLQELGVDSEPTPVVAPAVRKNAQFENALLRIGVRPNLVQLYASHLEKVMGEFNISTKNRKSMFLSQVLHESGMLTAVSENLNYSEQGLLKTFKKYFDRARAARYARNPQKIANRVYANRMGNGSEDLGDGWRFRGRGLIQLTGKDNYVACGKSLGVDLIKNPDYLTTPEGAARSAGWFWNSRRLNNTADANNIRENTRLINGGFNGLEHRQDLYSKLLRMID